MRSAHLLLQNSYRVSPFNRNFLTPFLPIIVLSISFLSVTSCRTLSPQKELDASLATTTWLEGRYGFVNEPQLARLLHRITIRLAEPVSSGSLSSFTSKDLSSYGTNYPWQIFVLDTLEPNAFSSGGGIVFLTRGLIRQLSSEAELAAVISHEMSHQLLGHTTDAIEHTMKTANHSEEGPRFHFTLQHEIDADTLGIRILNLARYDIRRASLPLSIDYRPLESLVSVNDPNWRESRLAHLQWVVENTPGFIPGTVSSREFNRIKRLM